MVSVYFSCCYDTPELTILSLIGPRYTGFYFAVQSGGNFEIDYVVLDPDDRVILEGQGEKQGDYIFTANKVRRHDIFTKLFADGYPL